MWSKAFWKSATERAVRTFAQTLGASWTVGVTTPLGMGWKQSLIVAVLGGVYSVVMSLGASKVGDSESPSLLTGGK